MSNIAAQVAVITTGARTALRYSEMSNEDALNLSAKIAVETATRAWKRTNEFQGETTSEEIEAAIFCGVVAQDILDGNVVRPSVGNVREYALNNL